MSPDAQRKAREGNYRVRMSSTDIDAYLATVPEPQQLPADERLRPDDHGRGRDGL